MLIVGKIVTLHSRAIAATIVLVAALVSFDAAAAARLSQLGTSSAGPGIGLRGGLAAHQGFARPFGSGIGSGYIGRNGGSSRQGSGWNRGGFGGTLSLGWGYRFGPDLGGLGR